MGRRPRSGKGRPRCPSSLLNLLKKSEARAPSVRMRGESESSGGKDYELHSAFAFSSTGRGETIGHFGVRWGQDFLFYFGSSILGIFDMSLVK